MDKELEFTESLYEEAEEQIKEVYKEQKENRDELIQKIAMIMLVHTVLDGLMSLSRLEKAKEYNKLSKFIKKFIKDETELQENVIENILTDTVKKTFKFYSYNHDLKDVRKIIESNFKGKHFSERVWGNETEVAKKLHSQIKDFLDGKVNVNQIKREIEKTFNNGAYNTKRLVETEVARCSADAFDRFCKETGVKKVRYNATLDNKLCDDCAQYHDKVYDFENKIERPRHPMCRCFYTIEDDDYKRKSRVDEEIAVSKEDYSDIISSKEWLNANFSSQKKFESHFKHLSEYGDITQEEYLNIARELLSADLSEDVEGFISNQGWAFKYRKSTNDFAMGHPKGTISTLFKPKEGYKYFLSEKEKYQ